MTPEEEYQKRYPKDEEYRKRFTKEFSEAYYKHKMLELVDNEEDLAGYVPGLILPNHMMFRIDTLESGDKHRLYEFLIEYNKRKPSEGIYYGCRGITKEGFDHEKEIEIFRDDWENIKVELCTVLNNTFTEKDFSHRFKMTDNANTNTYWLFWISLQEDEDINEVGVVAVKKIRDVFQKYLDDEAFRMCLVEKKQAKAQMLPKKIQVKTAFMQANYDILRSAYVDPNKFDSFIDVAVNEGWLKPHTLYEAAWQFMGDGSGLHYGNTDFIAMMLECAKQICPTIKGEDSKGNILLPWAQLECVFLENSGTAFENLRTQNPYRSHKKDIYWEEKIKKIKKNIH